MVNLQLGCCKASHRLEKLVSVILLLHTAGAVGSQLGYIISLHLLFVIEATLPDKISLDTSPEQRLWSSLTLSPLQMLLVANVSMPSSRPILRRAAGGGGGIACANKCVWNSSSLSCFCPVFFCLSFC